MQKLILSIFKNDIKTFKKVFYGVDLEKRDYATLLATSCGQQKLDFVIFFIQMGVCVNNEFGDSYLDFCSFEENDYIPEILLEAGIFPDPPNTKDSWYPLHRAVFVNNLYISKKLIQKGASHSPINREGNTPLHLACLKGHIECVNLLINCGSDPNYKNGNNESSWDVVESNHVEIFKIFIKSGYLPLDIPFYKEELSKNLIIYK